MPSPQHVSVATFCSFVVHKDVKHILHNTPVRACQRRNLTTIRAGIFAICMLLLSNPLFQQEAHGNRQPIKISSDAGAVAKLYGYATNCSLSQQSLSLHAKNDFAKPIRDNTINKEKAIATTYLIIVIVVLIFLVGIVALLMRMQGKRINLIEESYRAKSKSSQLEIDRLQQSLSDKLNLQEELGRELKFRQGEMLTMAMSIIRKNEFLDELKSEVVKIKSKVSTPETRQALNKLSLMIAQDISIDRDREKFQMNIHAQHSNFLHKLKEAFPSMTENEKRLASMLRLNLSSKEIASILNISTKSVEMNRYRLRKKLKVDPKVSINDFIRDF
jgi:DNA-directed RNA polymerase specialized sigma24 family protein